jgi:hypothetical protein
LLQLPNLELPNFDDVEHDGDDDDDDKKLDAASVLAKASRLPADWSDLQVINHIYLPV